jgi:hypothetical protein|tara:strand:+ start:391 stop:741 length:351 start_codon:yes stop_codon:yes gene_type:complete
MNRYALLGISSLAAFLISMSYAAPAFAFYTIETYGGQYGSEETSSGAFGSLEEQLELAKRKVQAASDNPATGSGTPYMDASGVVGASVIAGAIFGGIATAFFVRGKQGRYAAYGRG